MTDLIVQDIPLRFSFLLLGDGPCAAGWDHSRGASRPVQTAAKSAHAFGGSALFPKRNDTERTRFDSDLSRPPLPFAI